MDAIECPVCGNRRTYGSGESHSHFLCCGICEPRLEADESLLTEEERERLGTLVALDVKCAR